MKLHFGVVYFVVTAQPVASVGGLGQLMLQVRRPDQLNPSCITIESDTAPTLNFC